MASSALHIFELFARRFQILRVGGASADEQIGPSFDVGQSYPGDALNFEREVRRHPERRLLYELGCPIDCPPSEQEALYNTLADSTASVDELLQFADRLWPLARANFVAHVISHRPANAALLYALLESHAAIEASEIYAKLTASRTAVGIPAPSLANVNQGLDDLLTIHSEAAFAGYDKIEDALEPTLECTLQVIENGERYLVEALGNLLRSYSQQSGLLQKDTVDQITSACAGLREQPDDLALRDRLVEAVETWMATTRPLLIWSASQGNRHLDFDTPVAELRKLITDLVTNSNYGVAEKISDLTRGLFCAIPTTMDQLVEDARLIETLSTFAGISQLEKVISELEDNPGHLTVSLEQDGFGPTASEPAKELWDAFVRAATNRQSEDTAWRSVRDFAIRLSNRPEAAMAVVRMLEGLIEYGESATTASQFLRELRDNLSFMRSFIGTEPDETNTALTPAPPKKSPAWAIFWGRFRRGISKIRGRKRYRLGLTALVLFVFAACTAAALEFDRVRMIWSELLGQAPALALSAERMPPVGSGQHLDLDGVRYCRFQQERLRYIKQHVQGPEDARTYNLLIVDYNSRCSDFFYQDADLKAVLAEIDAKKRLLEADAERMMSAWPGHAAAKN